MEGESKPRSGLVSQLRQNWSVYEDEALATKIQHEEINKHYSGNRSRNQQIREDLPQAKQAQYHELKEAQQREYEQRRLLEYQADLDAQVAKEMAWREDDKEYIRRRDALFARNLQDLEIKQRNRPLLENRPPSALQSRADQLPSAQLGRSLADHRPPSAMQAPRTGLPPHQSLYGLSESENRHHSDPHTQGADRRPWHGEPHTDAIDYLRHEENIGRASSRLEKQVSGLDYNDADYRRQVARPAVVTDEPVYANNELDILTGGSGGRFPPPTSQPAEIRQPLFERGSFIAAEARLWSGDGDAGEYGKIVAPPPTAAPNIEPTRNRLASMEAVEPGALPGLAGGEQRQWRGETWGLNERDEGRNSQEKRLGEKEEGRPSQERRSKFADHSLVQSTRQRNSGHLNTSSTTEDSEYNNRASSRTSTHGSRSESSLSSYSEMGACGGAQPALIAPTAEEILGLGAALSPAELRAAEAAEQLLEQEKRDALLAQRLQEELEASEDETERDRRLAIEAQDREFARVLQAKEKARARRAKEKAQQRKLEKQQQQQQQQQQLRRVENGAELNLDLDLSRASLNDARESTGPQGGSSRSTPREGGSARRDEGSTPREGGGTRLSPRTPSSEMQPPARKPYVHTQAIDSHVNDSYCKKQITPTSSNSSETSEPQYANLDENGQPYKTEPCLLLPSSKSSDRISPKQSILNEDMPIPPYMPMQSCASKKSESIERKIKRKKEKEGCKQQ